MAGEPLIKLFLRRQSQLLGYLMAITRDLDAAEEIFQDCAVIMMESAAREDIRDFAPWAKEVVRRQALRYVRERSRGASHVRHLEPALLEGISRAFEEDTPDEEASHDERGSLRMCIEELGAKSRKMLALRYEEKRSFEEIGRLGGSTAGAVQRALSRLRKALHDCVKLRLRPAGE